MFFFITAFSSSPNEWATASVSPWVVYSSTTNGRAIHGPLDRSASTIPFSHEAAPGTGASLSGTQRGGSSYTPKGLHVAVLSLAVSHHCQPPAERRCQQSITASDAAPASCGAHFLVGLYYTRTGFAVAALLEGISRSLRTTALGRGSLAPTVNLRPTLSLFLRLAAHDR